MTLNPVLRVDTQMIEAIQAHENVSREEAWERSRAALLQVGIPSAEERLKSYPHQFSGGMRQRICIAMALLVEPKLLLADEPTTALDATLEVQIINLLKRLQKDIGCSILFVSHHLGTVAELCDDVVVMYAGAVVESGPVRDIFHRPSHPYTQALLACDPGRIQEKTRHLPTIPGDVPALIDVPTGCIFKSRCPERFARCEAEAPPAHPIASHADGQEHRAACHLREPATEEA